MPLITRATRIAKSLKTLIDNIFFNEFSNDIINGNLTVGISNHVPQFALITSNFQIQNTNPKITKDIRKFKQLNTHTFNKDLKKMDCIRN